MATRTVQGASLMVIAIGILVLPGILVNNLQNNGLISTSQTQVCNQQLDTCTLSANVGCQYSPTNCSLQGSSVQFLNPCSVWTNILTLNYVGFVSSFFTNCGQSTQQQQFEVNNNVGANQTVVNSSPLALAGSNTTFTGCTQGKYGLFGPAQTSFVCPTSNPSPLYFNNAATVPPFGFACGMFAQTIGNATSSPPIKPSLVTCNLEDSGTSTVFISSVSCWIYGVAKAPQPANIREAVCKTNTLITYGISLGTGLITSSSISFGSILGFGLSLLGATVVLFIGLGINIGAISATLGSNPQGTKLAQTYGMGLLLFMPLYSEFSTWFSNGYLPAGLDGNIFNGQLGIVSVVLVVCMFLGLYFVSQSGTTSQ